MMNVIGKLTALASTASQSITGTDDGSGTGKVEDKSICLDFIKSLINFSHFFFDSSVPLTKISVKELSSLHALPI